MPKQQVPRIIDIRRGSGTASGAPLTSGSGGGGEGAVEANAGAGLYYSVGALNVGAGSGISVTADAVALAASVAGAGLTHTTGVLAVGAGTLVTVGANAVGITAGANYQFIGMTDGAAAWHDLSELAGDGTSMTTGVLNIGEGAGLTVASNSVALTTPGTLSVSSTNAAAGSHTHVVTSSSNPGAAASILASTAAGGLTLVTATATTKVTTPKIDTASGDLTLQPADDILLDPVSELVKFLPSTGIQTNSYASQVTGWRITYDGQADFRYLYTDELHAKKFIADLEQALAGGQIICKSVSMLALTFTAPSAGSTSNLFVRDLPSAPGMAVFEAGDIVRIRNFSRADGGLSITDCWGVVTTYVDQEDKTQKWTFTRSAAPNAGAMEALETVAPDSIVLDYGTSGMGYYEVNAIDGLYGANSPYSQIVTWITHPATNTTVRTRLGNLYGLFSVENEYGLYAGTGTDTTSDKIIRISNTAQALYNVPLNMYSAGTKTVQLEADGDFALGANVNLVADRSLTVLSTAQTYNSEVCGAGDIVFGNHSAGHMFWDKSAGQLKFRESTTTQILIDTDGILKATNTKLSALGLSIKPEISTVTTGTPEPSAVPDTTPTATNYIYFPDPAATWTNTIGGTTDYEYAGGDVGRLYGYVEHIVPTAEDEGFWTHKSWLVLAAREPTLPDGSGSWASEIYAQADILRPSGVIRAGGAGGLKIQDDAGNLGVFVEDGGSVGIGTDSPTTNLHIIGTGKTDVRVQGASTGSANLYLHSVDTNGVEWRIGSTSSVAGTGAGALVFYDDTSDVYRMTLFPTGNLALGGTALRGTTVGTNSLHIFNGTAPAGTLTNGCSIYSTSGELYTMDAAGNATLQTPHDEAGAWVFDSKNTVTGRRLVIDMEKMLRALNKRFGWDFVHEFIEAL